MHDLLERVLTLFGQSRYRSRVNPGMQEGSIREGQGRYCSYGKPLLWEDPQVVSLY